MQPLRGLTLNADVNIEDHDSLIRQVAHFLDARGVRFLCLRITRFHVAYQMYSIAVRIAQALGLHKNSCYTGIPRFQAEMRRRLWWILCVSDSGLAMDRGTDLMVIKGSFNTRLPLHINDADIWLGGPEEVPEREEFTDMTFRYKIAAPKNYFVSD